MPLLAAALIIAILFPPNLLAGSPPVAGLSKPLNETNRDLEMDNDVSPPAPAKLSCFIYPGFAVVQKSRPSLRGAESIEVRLRPTRAHKSPLEAVLCANDFAGGKRVLNVQDRYFLGAVDSFLFFDCADSHGGACPFSLFDAKDGKKLLDAVYQKGQPLQLETKGRRISLLYHQVLTQSSRETCLPTEKDHRCWDQILSENKIAAGDGRLLPKCEKLFAKDPSLRASYGTQFSLPVEWIFEGNGNRKGSLTYLKGEPVCDLSP